VPHVRLVLMVRLRAVPVLSWRLRV